MEKMKVSFAAIILNEEDYIEKMLNNIIGKVDEIVIVDGGSTDKTLDILKDYPNIKLFEKVFNYHYGDQRNFAIMQTIYPWILMLDADEILENEFWELLPSLINQDKYDAYGIPRKNFIDNKFCEETYPDYQVRLFRRYCRWIYPVHEELVGFKSSKQLNCHILHYKSSERFNYRNSKYELIYKIWENDFAKKT